MLQGPTNHMLPVLYKDATSWEEGHAYSTVPRASTPPKVKTKELEDLKVPFKG